MRRFFCILLLLCLPLQSIAMHCERMLAADVTMLAHAIEADDQSAHHHGDDGSVHYADGADESAQHVLDHSCSPQPATMAPAVALLLSLEPVTHAPPDALPFVPDPHLDDPLRPPAFSLG